MKRTRTILVDGDQFGELFKTVISDALKGICDLKFFRFKTEAELRKLAETGNADLIFLYIGNITWNPRPPGPLPPGCSNGIYACHVYTLGEISTRFGIPIIATQGMNLRAEAEQAGIIFLEAPFKAAELMTAVHSVLGLDPPRRSES